PSATHPDDLVCLYSGLRAPDAGFRVGRRFPQHHGDRRGLWNDHRDGAWALHHPGLLRVRADNRRARQETASKPFPSAEEQTKRYACRPSGRRRGTRMRTVASLVPCILFLTSCAVGPNYKRPSVNTPPEYRQAASDTNVYSTVTTFAELGWWETFKDPQLIA